jgi:NAD(P)-dependent dehydrogenase (short-subunit alcohol dehydrogenase family)
MNLKNAVVFVTGANRGIGLAFAKEALARGALKVYAGARDVDSVKLAGVEAIELDVTDDAQVLAAAQRCGDVTLLINNAGIGNPGGFMAEDGIESARRQLDTNFYGPLRMTRAFAPVLAANGGGAIINVLSAASWLNSPRLSVYGATKTAAWALTNGLRNDLRAQHTQVLGMHVGFVETDLTDGMDVPKSSPDAVVRSTYDALEAGADEVLADDRAKLVKAGVNAEPSLYLAVPKA